MAKLSEIKLGNGVATEAELSYLSADLTAAASTAVSNAKTELTGKISDVSNTLTG